MIKTEEPTIKGDRMPELVHGDVGGFGRGAAHEEVCIAGRVVLNEDPVLMVNKVDVGGALLADVDRHRPPAALTRGRPTVPKEVGAWIFCIRIETHADFDARVGILRAAQLETGKHRKNVVRESRGVPVGEGFVLESVLTHVCWIECRAAVPVAVDPANDRRVVEAVIPLGGSCRVISVGNAG